MRQQREKIKALFESRPGDWIPLPEIQPYAAQYGTRIFELKRPPYSMNIVNMTKRVDGIKHSWYKYTPKVVVRADKQYEMNLRRQCAL